MRANRGWRWSYVVFLLVAVACEPGTNNITAPRGTTSSIPIRAVPDLAASSVDVADVEALYAAINNPANAGTVIVLAPGTYVLTPTTAAGAARPNAGRLELQLDMSLFGLSGDRSAVVIDARSLPAASFTVPFGRTGPIRMGRGQNSVEWLSVLGPPSSASGIATDLTGTSSTTLRVAHIFASGSSRGIDVRNVSASMIGRSIDIDLVDNELVGPTQIIGMSEGIRLANFVGAHNGTIVANMSGNRASGYQIGCILANNRSNNASISARSNGDRFTGNSLGCLIAGGLSQTTGNANGNQTTFEAYGSRFDDNTAETGFPPGGVQVAGGLSTVTPNVTSNNTVVVSLWGSSATGNLGKDFEAFGAWMESAAGIAGTGNVVTINLHGVSKNQDITSLASLPPDPGNTNTITINR